MAVLETISFTLPKLGSKVMGRCKHCGNVVFYRDCYIVRPEVWSSAGMVGFYGSGHLHQTCLEQRIGRPLDQADLLAWVVGKTFTGKVKMEATTEVERFLSKAA